MTVTTPPATAANAPAKASASMGLPGFGEELDFRAITRLINRRKAAILQTTLAVIVFAMLMAFILPPRFEAEAIVMLDIRHTQVVDMQQVMSGLAPDAAVVRSEMDILQSRAMIGRVVDKLSLTSDPDYNKSLGTGLLSWLDFSSTNLSDEERTIRERTGVIDKVSEHLELENDGRSYGIHIRFTADDPAKAARIANAFADAYLVDQLEAKYEATERANSWLSERLDKLKRQVEIDERAVAEFRRAHNLTDVSGSTLTTQQLGQINSQLIAARAERSQAEARLRAAQSMVQSTGRVDSSAAVLSSELISKLREQESQVEREMADLGQRYGGRHPKIISKTIELRDLRAKINQEVQKVVQSLANEVEVARAKEGSLKAEVDRLEGRAEGDSQTSVTLHQLEREADASKSLYESFLNRFKQTSEQANLQQADARIIARGEPPLDPFFPDPFVFLIISIFGGLGLGLVLAYLIEYFDRGFRGASQIEQMTGHATIGIIPSLRGTTDKAPEDYIIEKPLSSYSEALRSVRTAIHFSNVDQPPKIVMVTSALPNEGKTTVSMSMCRSLALAGNKVLLIEGDLRRPRLRKAMGAPTTIGDIAQLVAGDKKLDQVVQVDKPTGLHYIVSHGGTPSPQDLLGSQHMAKLLKSFAETYDLVVVDMPPILAVSDAALVGRITDTCVFVVRWAETPRDVVCHAIKQLTSFNVRLAGVVLSQVDLEEHAKYGYGDQGYYYGRYREYYSN
ncbi:MAG: polysaccharide biosynthesis tyrosine autokinase [Alphaproteobacteria bacterium]|nr:polysaccharide biosynthesis tyrosine autokinase [Alphaproteobacteria bacterium]